MMDGQIEAHMDTLVIEEVVYICLSSLYNFQTKQLLETLKLSNVVAAVQNLREVCYCCCALKVIDLDSPIENARNGCKFCLSSNSNI